MSFDSTQILCTICQCPLKVSIELCSNFTWNLQYFPIKLYNLNASRLHRKTLQIWNEAFKSESQFVFLSSSTLCFPNLPGSIRRISYIWRVPRYTPIPCIPTLGVARLRTIENFSHLNKACSFIGKFRGRSRNQYLGDVSETSFGNNGKFLLGCCQEFSWEL